MQKKNPIIDIIVIGDEILSGKTRESNAPFISYELLQQGFAVRSVAIVKDREEGIIHTVRDKACTADILIITGGLGPTPDDITRFAVSKAIDKPLALFSKQRSVLRKRLKGLSQKIKKMTDIEAFLPRSCTPLTNAVGMAYGFRVAFKKCILFCIPGVPAEARGMMERNIIPYITKTYIPALPYCRVLKTIGSREAALYSRIKNFLPQSVTLGMYPKGKEVEIRLYSEQKKVVEKVHKRLHTLLENDIYAIKDISLPETIVHLLAKKKLTCAFAESCTGGLISKRLTDVAGSSAVFLGAYVTYSNVVKNNALTVPQELFKKYGAVSPQVARSMVQGLMRKIPAEIGLSVTGIAGPNGGTKAKPVGLVYLGVSYQGKTRVQKLQFSGDREKIRWLASQAALEALWRAIR